MVNNLDELCEWQIDPLQVGSMISSLEQNGYRVRKMIDADVLYVVPADHSKDWARDLVGEIQFVFGEGVKYTAKSELREKMEEIISAYIV